ncbi:unnamed protein product [Staurois parvus]|uniref:Uncharacterized protein n=1 Tax=Staurois parvus TaxID=386267 RepID=A0ABN9CLT4_9NEOB|nr:unnamed protein product [Staurois parvus]
MGTTVTQPQSDRPHKMTEQGQRMLKCTVCRNHQLSTELETSKFHVAFRLAQQCVENFIKWAAASKPYIAKCSSKH